MFVLRPPSRSTVLLTLCLFLLLLIATSVAIWSNRPAPTVAAIVPFSSTANSSFPGTNGSVTATVASSVGDVCVGGSFSFVGPRTRHAGMGVFTESGVSALDVVFANSSVFSVAADEAGGWYIGGSFTTIDGETRSGMAHILADGSLDPDWVANTTASSWGLNQVDALVFDSANDVLYAGGSFATVNGTASVGIVALDPATGDVLTSWSSGTNQHVSSLVLDGTTLYVGGHFTTFGGVSRTRLFAIDTTTSLMTAWNPSVNNNVRAMKLNGSLMYVGGTFTSAGGQSRSRLAAIDTSTGLADAWNPGTNGTVESLAIDASTLYVGGDFTTAGGQSRTRLAGIDLITGAATSLDQPVSTSVLGLLLDDSTLYLALLNAAFPTVNNEYRTGAAAVDVLTGSVTSFSPALNNGTKALAVANDLVFIGGAYTSSGGDNDTRAGIACIDTDGTVVSFAPDADNAVSALVFSSDDSVLYAGGSFTSIGGQTRTRIAAIDTATGLATSLNATANNTVSAFARSSDDSTLYAGGSFTVVSGDVRNRIAAIDTTTGLATSWNPNANNTVSAFALSSDGSTLYVGGSFTSIGGQTRNRIAAIDTTTGLATSWNANANGTVSTLFLSADDSTLYVGGSFTSIGGQARNRIAAIDTATGLATSWNPNANNTVSTAILSSDESLLYVGGSFTTIGGQARNRIAAIDTATGLATSWDANASSTVSAIAISTDDRSLYVGGAFSRMNDVFVSTLAQFSRTSRTGGSSLPYVKPLDPKVTVISPNGGETFRANETVFLSWVTEGRIDLVTLLLSTDAGAHWEEIARAIPNNGTFSWVVPDSTTESALIRIEATDNAVVYASDESDAIFTIEGTRPRSSLPPVAPGTLMLSPFSGEEERVQAVSPGDLLVSPHIPRVFAVSPTYHRRPFVDETVIFTYVDDVSRIRTVTDVTLMSLVMGAPMPPKAETVLVRFQGSSDVYAVLPSQDGSMDPYLQRLDTVATARTLFGENWASFVLFLGPSLYQDFVVTSPLFGHETIDATHLIPYADLRAKVNQYFSFLQSSGYHHE